MGRWEEGNYLQGIEYPEEQRHCVDYMVMDGDRVPANQYQPIPLAASLVGHVVSVAFLTDSVVTAKGT